MAETHTAVILMYITANNFQTEIHVHCTLNCAESTGTQWYRSSYSEVKLLSLMENSMEHALYGTM